MSMIYVSSEEAARIRRGEQTQYRTPFGFKYLNKTPNVWTLIWYEREQMYALAYKPDPTRLIPIRCPLGVPGTAVEIVDQKSGQAVCRATITEAKPQRLGEIGIADLNAEGLPVGDTLSEAVAEYHQRWDKQYTAPHRSASGPWTWRVQLYVELADRLNRSPALTPEESSVEALSISK